MKVLICERDATRALDLWSALIERGHQVCGTARTAAESREKVRSLRPNLAFVAAHLNDGPVGRDLVEEMDRLRVPTVIVADGQESPPGSASAKGILRMPFDIAQVWSVLSRIEGAAQPA